MRFAAAFTLLASAAIAYAQNVVLNTPSGVSECFITLLTWTPGSGTGPYQIQVLPGGQPAANPLDDLGIHDGTQFSWLCKQAAGTSVFLRLRDTSNGQLSETASFNVAVGDPKRCATVSQGTTTTGATTPPVPPPTGPTTTTTNPGETVTTTKSTSGSASKSSSGSGTAPTSSQGGAGYQVQAPVALAGAAALAMAVFA